MFSYELFNNGESCSKLKRLVLPENTLPLVFSELLEEVKPILEIILWQILRKRLLSSMKTEVFFTALKIPTYTAVSFYNCEIFCVEAAWSEPVEDQPEKLQYAFCKSGPSVQEPLIRQDAVIIEEWCIQDILNEKQKNRMKIRSPSEWISLHLQKKPVPCSAK